jgi:hypothetical protein
MIAKFLIAVQWKTIFVSTFQENNHNMRLCLDDKKYLTKYHLTCENFYTSGGPCLMLG